MKRSKLVSISLLLESLGAVNINFTRAANEFAAISISVNKKKFPRFQRSGEKFSSARTTKKIFTPKPIAYSFLYFFSSCSVQSRSALISDWMTIEAA
jgi:hypothetical protein